MIAWELKENFRSKSVFHFYVDYGFAGTDSWEVLNESPIVDACSYVDVRQRQFDHTPHYYYRVRLVLPEEINPTTGVCRVITSMPQQANGLWSKPDWLVAREICRKEYLMQRKRTVLTAVGWLFKRKRWGTQCTKCTDYDTGDVMNADCTYCFGTRFDGGYYPAVRYVISLDPPGTHEFKIKSEKGFDNDIWRTGRSVNFPHIDTDDVFFRADNGERFWIKKITAIVEIGGIPVVVKPQLKLATATDIIYTIPLTGGSSSSVSSLSSEDACGSAAKSDDEAW